MKPRQVKTLSGVTYTEAGFWVALSGLPGSGHRVPASHCWTSQQWRPALKRVAIGRKNWLFAGNDAAAENHARLWSLIASCERHKVDPQRYLTSVLAKFGTTPREELEQFLADVWKAEDTEHSASVGQ